ncbi:vitamin K epoxide reductase family protein [Tenggerimyces flavus]|uniref:Vitamin K epoxide reductase family protein n=1 Tax=Tenggerimyces flavus TaxID=1708749 RepID=A0ABV7Y812_9ACTN|nr:vitamin K epoxide reductase family protein [Tenggerimyces flavus]MBM7791011.1 putative membrane protein [Tenggerimyces flavus]
MQLSQTDTENEAEADAAEPAPFARMLPWLLVIGGILGFAAAFVLTVERIELLKNPAYVPSCSISPILSCGSVMTKPQAAVLGFPNPLLGIAGFAVVVTIGMALLAGARLPRWFWLGLQAGATIGVGFIHWLIVQSLYSIGALCPYCMVVWVVTIPIFWYVTLFNLRRQRWARILIENHAVVLTVWLLGILGLIVLRFWDYWVSLI